MKVLRNILLRLKIAKVNNTEKYRFFYASLWNIIGTGSARFILLITAVLVARLVGAEVYGKWGIIRSTISMFTVLLGFGLSSTSLKYIAEFRSNDKDKVTRIISLSLFIALVTGVFLTVVVLSTSPMIADKILNDTSLVIPLDISAFFLLFIALNSFLTGAIGGFEKFKYIALSNLISCVLGGPLIVYFTFKYGLIGLTSGYLIYYLLYALSLHFFLRKLLINNSINLSIKNLYKEIDTFKNFSTPAIISSLIGGPATWIVFAFVTRQDNGFVLLGIYNAAKIAQNIIMELASQIHSPLISILSNSNNSKSMTGASFIVPWMFISIIVLPLIYVPESISWMFNKGGYLTADFNYVISITLFTTYIMIFKQSINRITVTKNLMWWGVYENIFWALILLVFTVILVPKFGVVGLALAFMLSYLFDLIAITPFYLRRKLIPYNLILSLEATACWLSAFLGLLLLFINISLEARIIILSIVFVPNLLFISKLKLSSR